ncbi:hypothetical protein AAV32_09670 [Kerstersia gyiorum]|uniref:Uncharacterized protein n=1 Tax=Kerstersia gyiorum TaxID=206506 RepID=A0A171KSG4_9BURK|nr:hypothetical protein AAV32_09670 [Kerstersia gyiorum]
MMTYQVGEAASGYDAVGCGADIALGALCATTGMADHNSRIGLALHAAEAHSAGVRGPFTVLSIGGGHRMGGSGGGIRAGGGKSLGGRRFLDRLPNARRDFSP